MGATPSPDERLAAEAYLYGFPLVFNLEQVRRFVTTGVGAVPAAPFNTFSHGRGLATAADTFVSINNDTLYSMAQLDLSVGPILLRVPDTGGRYYVLQFVDAWTNNFAYVGQRATGTAAGEFLIVPPGWSGRAPGAATVINCPTRIVSIVGRWGAGPDDLPAVHALQDATTLTALEPAAAAGLPPAGEGMPEDLGFFEEYRVWSREFAPASRDLPSRESFAPLGLTGDIAIDDLDAGRTAALSAGYIAGGAELERLQRSGVGPSVNGWARTLHLFDYNLDFFEIGTIDDDRWKIADPKARIAQRAAAARGGLWGNHGYEAVYLMTYVDGDGTPLDGSNTYTLKLSPPPPVGAFWSMTMYDTVNFYLVDNPIARYSIGDRTPGLVADEDGGYTITIGHAEPADAGARANWLPAPAGDFRPILRMYVPHETVLNGDYVVPAISRTV